MTDEERKRRALPTVCLVLACFLLATFLLGMSAPGLMRRLGSSNSRGDNALGALISLAVAVVAAYRVFRRESGEETSASSGQE